MDQFKTQAGKATRGRGRPAGKKADSSELKIKLIEAALELFGLKGFDGASLSQIAKKAGTDIGLSRHYFGSKDGLWKAAINHLTPQLMTELLSLELEQYSTDTERLKALIQWFVDMSARQPHMSQIIVRAGSEPGEHNEYIAKEIVGPFYEFLTGVIAGAIKEGGVPDVPVRTIFFQITLGGSFPIAMPELTNTFPGGDITSESGLKAHADALIKLIIRDTKADS